MLILGASDLDIDCLCASCLKLRSGLLDLQIGSKPACIPVLDQLQCLFILRYGRVQKLLLGIERASLKVVQGQLGVHGQVHSGQVGCAGLCLLTIRLNGATHAPPYINLVRQFERNLKIVVGDAVEG